MADETEVDVTETSNAVGKTIAVANRATKQKSLILTIKRPVFNSEG